MSIKSKEYDLNMKLKIQANVMDTNRGDDYNVSEIEFQIKDLKKVIKNLNFDFSKASCFDWMNESDDDKVCLKASIYNTNDEEMVSFETLECECSVINSDNSYYSTILIKGVKWFLSLKCLDPITISKNEAELEKLFKKFLKENKINSNELKMVIY